MEPMPVVLLDLFTITIFTAIGLSFLAVIMLCTWFGNRRYDGVGYWLIASLLVLVYSFIMAEQLWLFKLEGYASHTWLNVMRPNILLCLAVCLIAHGFHRFLQINQSLLWLYAAQCLLIVPLYAYGLTFELLPLHTTVLTTASTSISFLFISRYLISYQAKQYGMTRVICLLTCGLSLLLSVTRLVLLVQEEPLLNCVEITTAIACINMLMTQCFLTFCYLMLCTQRNAFSLQHMSFTDPLANIYNRRGYQHAIAALAPHKEAAVMILDIDHFKNINDEYGHAMGDLVIKDIANIIAKTCGSMCVYARTGGEEFSIYSPLISASKIENLAEEIRLVIMDHTTVKAALAIKVTASIGISVGQSVNVFALEEEADKALYQAKRDGRNCTVMQLSMAS
ncbi:GGDEF domain-containing protein [Moritella sp. F3]|nr:GGDEF domain-containing protein [Moritella sp. F1]GIC80383.1 GGDEF domain-containing protein [Moritella sp. F3]